MIDFSKPPSRLDVIWVLCVVAVIQNATIILLLLGVA